MSTSPPPEVADRDAPAGVLAELEAVLRQRRRQAPEGSYSATLLADPERATRKIMEEAFELCVELLRVEHSAERTAEEAADLVFHVLVGLAGAGVPLEDVLAELRRRRGGDGATGGARTEGGGDAR